MSAPEFLRRGRRLSTAQAAKVLGVSPKTVRRYIAEGWLPAFGSWATKPQGTRYRILESDLEAFRVRFLERPCPPPALRSPPAP